uniref:C3H1-type domain-containing protein n=1 Tax=Neogobius melanostomus TaxID=47308 RepID=A0A8C6WVK2_9GOBI
MYLHVCLSKATVRLAHTLWLTLALVRFMRFTMESEILKFILNNQGSVDTEELVYNLWDYSLVTDILCKNDKFVPCLSTDKKPRVVVRSSVTICRVKDCPGSCGHLHLCLAFLFSESCPFRRGCSFSHDLQSDYNMEVLREFGLEALNRTELCLLLLQSNNTLLPPVSMAGRILFVHSIFYGQL